MKYRKNTGKLIISAVILGMTINMPVFAASALTSDAAKAIAEKVVPAGSVFYSAGNDGGRYEIKFYHDGKQEKYEVKVNKATQTVVSFDSELHSNRGASKVTLTEEEAKKAVTDDITGAEIISVKLDQDDGEYDVVFRRDDCNGTVTVHAQTGAVLERDIQVGVLPAAAAGQTQQITADKAMELALAQVPGGTVTDVDIERENGVTVYEVEVISGGMEYDLAFDAATGSLIWQSSSQNEWGFGTDKDAAQEKQPTSNHSASSKGSADKILTYAEAESIVLAKLPGSTVRDIELDRDDGRSVYEGEVRKDGLQYDFKIDANTGSVIEWERDD